MCHLCFTFASICLNTDANVPNLVDKPSEFNKKFNDKQQNISPQQMESFGERCARVINGFLECRLSPLSSRRSTPEPILPYSSVPEPSVSPKLCHLDKEGIRVLLYRECDKRGRKLLYDSKTIIRLPIPESSSSNKAIFRTNVSSNSSSSSNIRHHQSSLKPSSSSGSKLDMYDEINNGYGYRVSKFIEVLVVLIINAMFRLK